MNVVRGAELRDEQRRDERPDAIAASIRLCRTPNTRPTTFGGAARCSSVMPGDVDERAADAHQREEDERGGVVVRRREEDERDAEHRETETEVAGQPLARSEHDTDEPAEQAADAERGVEPADARVARRAARGSRPRRSPPRARRRRTSARRSARSRSADGGPRRSRGTRPAARCRSRARPRAPAARRAAGRATHTADQRYDAPASAKTSHGPLNARMTPPIAGPANMPTLAIVFSARFDAVSSSGVAASDG